MLAACAHGQQQRADRQGGVAPLPRASAPVSSSRVGTGGRQTPAAARPAPPARATAAPAAARRAASRGVRLRRIKDRYMDVTQRNRRLVSGAKGEYAEVFVVVAEHCRVG